MSCHHLAHKPNFRWTGHSISVFVTLAGCGHSPVAHCTHLWTQPRAKTRTCWSGPWFRFYPRSHTSEPQWVTSSPGSRLTLGPLSPSGRYQGISRVICPPCPRRDRCPRWKDTTTSLPPRPPPPPILDLIHRGIITWCHTAWPAIEDMSWLTFKKKGQMWAFDGAFEIKRKNKLECWNLYFPWVAEERNKRRWSFIFTPISRVRENTLFLK